MEIENLNKKKEEIYKLKIKTTTYLSNIQKIISEKMILSKDTIPHLYQLIKVDTTDLLNFKREIQEKISSEKINNIKITYTDFLIKIVSCSLRNNIEINSAFIDNKFIIYEDINIGLAISINNHVIVCTFYNSDKLELIEIALKRNELINKAINQKLILEEIKNSTFTITNIGMYGIRSSYAIINPPQSAILTVGQIYNEPVINSNNEIVNRAFIELTISADHRVINGVNAAKFLQNIKSYIENPSALIKI